MKNGHSGLQLLFSLLILCAPLDWLAAQANKDASGIAVSMVVTAESHHRSAIPNIASENVSVYLGRNRAKITDWVPLQGDRADLELFMLLDDARATSAGSQMADVGDFILALPATTRVGVAYMQGGGTTIVRDLTADHSLAAGALHASLGNLARSANPYVSLMDLMKKWPADKTRREILMISSGVDDSSDNLGPSQEDIYADSAIEEAQRAGIVISTIATSREEAGATRAGGTLESGDGLRRAQGRNYLAQVAERTGGESYFHPFGAPISFASYLEDLARRLNHQYMVTFLARPGKKNSMQPVRVRTDVPNTELVSAQRVYVPITQGN